MATKAGKSMATKTDKNIWNNLRQDDLDLLIASLPDCEDEDYEGQDYFEDEDNDYPEGYTSILDIL